MSAEIDNTVDTVVDGAQETDPQTDGQADLDAAIERRLVRERAIQDRRIQKLFGTKSLEEAAQLAEAGRAVSSAANVPPQTVVERVRQQYQQRQAQAGIPPTDDMRRELLEIKQLIASEREEKVRALEVSEAQKEFGNLFDQYKAEIEMVAEDKGLTLTDAAAVTLRPHLKKHYAQQIQARRQVAAQRKVEGSGEAPSAGASVDYDTILSPSQKMVAKRMGLTNKEYYSQLKELGKAPQ